MSRYTESHESVEASACMRAAYSISTGHNLTGNQMNYYAFHIGDYKAHTSHLSLIEDLAFRRMLDLYYLTESPLPDVKKIARAICMRENIEDIQTVLDEFFIGTEEGYIHNRCEREIKAMNDKSGKAKLSAQKRWSKTDNANAMPESCEGNANASNNHANASKTDANAMPESCEGNAPNPNPNPNPNINKKENASEDLEIQDFSHLYVAPNRRTYAMFAEWQPEPKTWAAYLKMSSHIVKPEQFTKYTLLEFIRLNVGKDEKMESEWQKFYVNAIARGYIKPEGQEAKPTNQPEPAIDYSKPQNLIKPIIYEYDPEERARQSAEMKRIRKEQGR